MDNYNHSTPTQQVSSASYRDEALPKGDAYFDHHYAAHNPPANEHLHRVDVGSSAPYDSNVPLFNNPHGHDTNHGTPNTPASNISAFGSPYAHNNAWSPTSADAILSTLPSLPFGLRVKERFARSPGDIFNPPCPSFTRPIDISDPPPKFQPYSIPCKGKLLSDGFKPIYPGNLLAVRDISAADWARFLEDLEVSGRLTGVQQATGIALPHLLKVTGPAGFLVGGLIRKHMRKEKEPFVWETLSVWEEKFFHQRGLSLDFVNALGGGRASGGDHSDSSSSSDDSDAEKRASDEDKRSGMGHRERDRAKKMREEAHKARKEERHRRHDREKDQRDKVKDHPYKLVITTL